MLWGTRPEWYFEEDKHGGTINDIAIHARETIALRAQLDALYARHTGQSAEQINADSERDRYMTPEEGVAYGLVDRIVRPR